VEVPVRRGVVRPGALRGAVRAGVSGGRGRLVALPKMDCGSDFRI